MTRMITVTSGKGGVGKTSISLNLSLALATMGFRVCLLDADLGLANINILTGIHPPDDLGQVIQGSLNLSDILIRNYQGIDIIPGSSGVEQLADLSPVESQRLIQAFQGYDYFIIDTSAGVSSQVLAFCLASHEILMVVTCEPTSLTDAYALLKILSRSNTDLSAKIIINQVKSVPAAQKAFAQLKDTVKAFLPIRITPLGIVVADRHVGMAVISQTPLTLLFPDAAASRCIVELGRRITSNLPLMPHTELERFWGKCISFLATRSHHTTKTGDPHQTQSSKISLKDIHARLDTIAETMAALAKEMTDLKTLITDIEPKISNTPHQGKTHLEPKKILLDFETWLSNPRQDKITTTGIAK